MPPRNFEVVSGGCVLGEAAADLVRAWHARGSRSWIAAYQVQPGEWSSQGAGRARTEFVTLRPR